VSFFFLFFLFCFVSVLIFPWVALCFSSISGEPVGADATPSSGKRKRIPQRPILVYNDDDDDNIEGGEMSVKSMRATGVQSFVDDEESSSFFAEAQSDQEQRAQRDREEREYDRRQCNRIHLRNSFSSFFFASFFLRLC
jgi:hypothetical protein